MKVAWIAVSGPPALKHEALARLEVIADTYLSMNAPVQWRMPAMLEERHTIQPQLMQRVRDNLAELDCAAGRAEALPAWRSKVAGTRSCGFRPPAPTKSLRSPYCVRRMCWCSPAIFTTSRATDIWSSA